MKSQNSHWQRFRATEFSCNILWQIHLGKLNVCIKIKYCFIWTSLTLSPYIHKLPRRPAEECLLSKTGNNPNAHQQEEGNLRYISIMQWNMTNSVTGREKLLTHAITRMNHWDSEECAIPCTWFFKAGRHKSVEIAV